MGYRCTHRGDHSGLILTERLDHTIGAMVGATAMMFAGRVWGLYGEEEAIAAIEFDALAVLLGMMVLVSILEPTGFFQYVAVKAGRLSKGDPLRLRFLFGASLGASCLPSSFHGWVDNQVWSNIVGIYSISQHNEPELGMI